MKTIYYTASSLDGFLATEDDSLAWLFALGASLDGEQGGDSGYATFIAGINGSRGGEPSNGAAMRISRRPGFVQPMGQTMVRSALANQLPWHGPPRRTMNEAQEKRPSAVNRCSQAGLAVRAGGGTSTV
ncbi:Dihydrofolate reductase [Thioalkalivibrio nitratireducens DSM 14787]|uniref:Dihydrofolate reductase n=1 Tax=Thioalkalivibrio nitratireducens (strain DSM 14787 / UNIQEM 213 / ALEN2) TaxID=1255043 RepID=L0DUM7_THIND|nr:hypothetical protein [Thioalkalivibrio nitratireducens]AGA32695.1 Dihydrofolate reductase [Thioalkalivibrio nitratireducens DSM 14787]